MGGALGASCLGLNWSEIAAAAHHAAAVNSVGGTRSPTFLTSAEVADVEAITAQIIPTDSTPGAREAGVLFFIDRGLTSFFAHQAVAFRAGLKDFQERFHTWRPAVSSFAALAPDQQIEFLRTIDQTPFFDSIRLLTVLGMFSIPAYGGNRNSIGWKLLGFVDEHAFQPPFGYYDRDYPGFTADPSEKRS